MTRWTRMMRCAALALLLGAGAAVPAVDVASADGLGPRAARKAMVRAGYSGIGGVVRSGNHYYASALSPRGRRVRVSLDARTGGIASITALPRGGSILPSASAPREYVPMRVDRPGLPPMADPYIPPPPPRRIGVVPRPGLPSTLGLPVRCRTVPAGTMGC